MSYELVVHRPIIVPKGWGREEIHWNGAICSKTMFISRGLMSSWHYHVLKDEVFRVIRGNLHVWYGLDHDIAQAKEILLKPGDTVHIPPGLCHRFKAVDCDECVFEEVSTHDEAADNIRILKGD